MKKIIFGLAVLFLCGLSVKAQIYVPPVQTIYGKHELRIRTDSALHVPQKNGNVLNTADTTAQIFVNRADSGFWYYFKPIGFTKLSTGVSSVSSPLLSTENYLNYNIPFASTSFTDSTLVSQLDAGTTSKYFNKGLRLNGTYTGTIDNSRLIAYRYGHLISGNFSQRLIFTIGDSSTQLYIGIGVKGNQILSNTINQIGDISAAIGSGTGYVENFCRSQSVSTSGVSINKGDYIELQLNQVFDSVTVYYRNISTGQSITVGRKVDHVPTTQDVSIIGYPTIYFAKGCVNLLSYDIYKQDFAYMILGNSITEGYRCRFDSCFVSQLRMNTNAVINNASRSAATSTDYLYVKDNFNFHNKTVILSGVFGNDAYNGTGVGISSAQSKANYISIVNTLRANGNKIVHVDNPYRTTFLGAGGWAALDSLNRWIDTTYKGIDSIVHTNTLLTYPTDYSDGVHPSLSGHTLIAGKIMRDVPNLFELQLPGVKTSADTNYYKPIVSDSSGKRFKVSWNNFVPSSLPYLPLAGGTLTGNLLFSTDNTKDIGASGATRPRTGYFGTSIVNPLLIGGTGTTSTLTLQPTSGAGTTGSDIIFNVGNNGGTLIAKMFSDGYTTFGSTTNYGEKLAVAGTYYGTGRMRVDNYGAFRDGVYAGGSNVPLARVHMAAGSAAVNTAPLKFTSGPYLTVDETGTIQFLSGKFKITDSLVIAGNVGIGTTSPNSTLHDNGSFATAYVAKTANYTLTSSDYLVEVTSGTVTETLPTAVGITGRIYVITNSGSGVVTLGTTSSQTFANVVATPTTLTLNQFATVTVISNGANWLRVTSL